MMLTKTELINPYFLIKSLQNLNNEIYKFFILIEAYIDI